MEGVYTRIYWWVLGVGERQWRKVVSSSPSRIQARGEERTFRGSSTK